MVLGPECFRLSGYSDPQGFTLYRLTKWVLRPPELHGTRTRIFQSVGLRAQIKYERNRYSKNSDIQVKYMITSFRVSGLTHSFDNKSYAYEFRCAHLITKVTATNYLYCDMTYNLCNLCTMSYLHKDKTYET